MRLYELLSRLRRDLSYVEGVGDGLSLRPLLARVETMRGNLNQYQREWDEEFCDTEGEEDGNE